MLTRATELEQMSPLRRGSILAKRRLALLFYESSTRTRTSFELAAKALGADTTLVSSLSSSIEKGESLKDTGLTLRALGAEGIILRHPSSGAAWLLEASTRLPVINAGDGMHEHPTQALLDLRTLVMHLRPGLREVNDQTLAGVTVSIVGDVLHSRVARSNMLLLPRLGARVLLCGPKELLPDMATSSGPGIEIERDFETALRASTAVMMLRIQAERLAGGNGQADAIHQGWAVRHRHPQCVNIQQGGHRPRGSRCCATASPSRLNNSTVSPMDLCSAINSNLLGSLRGRSLIYKPIAMLAITAAASSWIRS